MNPAVLASLLFDLEHGHALTLADLYELFDYHLAAAHAAAWCGTLPVALRARAAGLLSAQDLALFRLADAVNSLAAAIALSDREIL